MIDEVLKFLMENFNNPTDLGQDVKVTFPNGPAKSQDSVEFKQGINLLLLNLEQEHSLRQPDRYLRLDAEGNPQRVHPEIRLNLLVLFVAYTNEYVDALRALSVIIRFYQRHPLFSPQTDPPLNGTLLGKVEQLVVELVTPSLSEQNDIWNGLRLHYHPSVLYKIKTVVYKDETPTPETTIGSVGMRLSDTNTPPLGTASYSKKSETGSEAGDS